MRPNSPLWPENLFTILLRAREPVSGGARNPHIYQICSGSCAAPRRAEQVCLALRWRRPRSGALPAGLPRGLWPAAITATDVTRALYRKVSWHILLLPTLMYFVCALDISNISFAKLQMQHDIGISDAAYGLGASLFFIANMLFDIPS